MPVLTGSDEDMKRMGWSKKLVYGYVYENKDKQVWEYQPHYFDATRIPCTSCGNSDFAWVIVMPSGVYWSCGNCRITYGPLALDKTKGSKSTLLENEVRRLTPKEAARIMNQTGQKISKLLAEKLRRAGVHRQRIASIPEDTKVVGAPPKKKTKKKVEE